MEAAPAPDASAPELNHLRLRFGDALQLQFVGEDPRFAVRLIGYLDNRSIIVTAPVHNRRLIQIRAGQPLNIRMMVNDRACAFVTNVLHSYRLPYPHLHLEYPQELVTNQLRKAVRVEARIEGTVINRSIGERGKDIQCYLQDISETGTHLVTPIRIGKSGDDIELNIDLDISGIARRLQIPAILRGRIKVNTPESERRVHYGVEFKPLSEEARVALIAFIYWKLSQVS